MNILLRFQKKNFLVIQKLQPVQLNNSTDHYQVNFLHSFIVCTQSSDFRYTQSLISRFQLRMCVQSQTTSKNEANAEKN